ncbi:YTX2-like protein [Mya arenaria]|uniref:YTX2-like protein n=1 Tax=Mya arenaria TaxID=6604 RepID=A0ABY7FVB2_MYAAR|nr:YTX2-like protein [Mya arenaria]
MKNQQLISLTWKKIRGKEKYEGIDMQAATELLTGKSKSPGIDGIPAEWYQKFWYIIKHDFVELTTEILSTNKLCDTQYKGVLTLIYKNGDRGDLKNWRPLSILCVDYKIIAKALSNRIKPILSKIIHSDQKGYVEGRNINEANRYIQDLIEYTAQNKNEGLIIIFLEKTMAFDRCEWPWLNIFFPISRSIKQGCPVAPYLYIIQAEPIACRIRNNININDISMPDYNDKIQHAKVNQYVDDTQLFAKNESSLVYICQDLSLCEKVWKSRELTIPGKILLVKTYIFSAINFEVETRGISQKISNDSEQIMNNFIWNEKKPKVARDTLKREKDHGGVNLCSITEYKQALQIKMIYKIIHSKNEIWNNIGKYYLGLLDKSFNTNLFICKCSEI